MHLVAIPEEVVVLMALGTLLVLGDQAPQGLTLRQEMLIVQNSTEGAK